MNDLPVDMTPPQTRTDPEKKMNKRQKQGRVSDTQRQADMSDNTDSDSEDDSNCGYWLRIPAERTEERVPEPKDTVISIPARSESHTAPVYSPSPVRLPEEREQTDGNLPVLARSKGEDVTEPEGEK